MGQIYFKQFYTPIVEHCLHVVVSGRNANSLTQDWIDFTTNWLQNLSEKDKDFVTFVFGKDYFNSYEGLSCYHPEEDYHGKHHRLFELELDFAIRGGLVDEESLKSYKRVKR